MKSNRRTMSVMLSIALGIGGVGMSNGCSEIKRNPRTWGTIGGAAAGAGLGAAVDDDEPVRGAIIGGVVGGAAGNIGGKVYKDNR